ncbi:hypothetical protein D3C87_1844550 [compost metagenome]
MDPVAVSVSEGVTKLLPAPCRMDPLVTLTRAEPRALLLPSVSVLLFDNHRLPRRFDDSLSTLTYSGWLLLYGPVTEPPFSVSSPVVMLGLLALLLVP